eukprot:3763852-Rhodomonas_salina.4
MEVRTGRSSGSSVSVTSAPNFATASPHRPVPAPNSSTRLPCQKPGANASEANHAEHVRAELTAVPDGGLVLAFAAWALLDRDAHVPARAFLCVAQVPRTPTRQTAAAVASDERGRLRERAMRHRGR